MSHSPPTDQEQLLLAIRHFNEGDMGSAARLAQAVFTANPNHAEAIHLLGMIALRTGRLELATKLLVMAVELQPRQAAFHFHLGELYGQLGHTEAAERQYRQAIRLQPHFVPAHVHLGNLYFGMGAYDRAKKSYKTAVRLDPKTHIASYNLGIIAQEMGEHGVALHCFDQALQAAPVGSTAAAQAHTAKAFSLLALGRFREGWPEYEWRWQLPGNTPRICAAPLWDGLDIQGKRIYLYTEQGFGDALLFVRYIKRLRDRGGYVILECKPELLTLFQGSQLADEMVVRASGDATPPDFAFDCHLPLLSLLALPGIFAGPEPTLPDRVPYLRADPVAQEAWRVQLAALRGLRVAICWSGNPETAVNRNRACSLADFAPLLRVPGVSFVSIQKGVPAQQMRAQPVDVLDLDAQLTDFAQTAAVLANVDLLIATDTAVVHLAGGLGRPVWTLLHTAAEWRWLQHRLDTPWYPNMRLFRQTTAGDWLGLLERVAEELCLYQGSRGIIPLVGSRGEAPGGVRGEAPPGT
ncbi:MAG: tetratricopeptide repeat protein [Magnetococcales bacterium]|nr:tetratricopeptide repeat protein [Magnetococcales bacterium]